MTYPTKRLPAKIWRRARELANGCWSWSGAKDAKGQGVVRVNKQLLKAHRASYMVYHPGIPDGWHVLRSCENPKCVHPQHLYAWPERGTMVPVALLAQYQVLEAVKLGTLSNLQIAERTGLTPDAVYAIDAATYTYCEDTLGYLYTPPQNEKP